MSDDLEEVKKFKDYPEGSLQKQMYDNVFLTFVEYLEKYHSHNNIAEWTNWMSRYVTPAFNKASRSEMIKNFGYASLEMYDFNQMEMVYLKISEDKRLSKDIRMFIGFLAGAGFFNKHKLTIEEWLMMDNWFNPFVKSQKKGITLNEIINLKNGENFLRANFIQMPFWNRDSSFD